MITKLELNNFRCFQNFVIEGFRPVTLIAGANGVGKSTILESIFLFNERNSHNVFTILNSFRGIHHNQLSMTMLWEHLFTNSDVNNIITISSTTKHLEKQCLTLEKDSTFSLFSLPELKSQAHLLGYPDQDAYSLKLVYNDSTHNDTSLFTVTANNIILTSHQPILTSNNTHYICSKISYTSQHVAEWYGKILKGNKSQQCIDILQILDKRITQIYALPQGGTSTLFVKFESMPDLPINALGDGINKLITTILVMLSHRSAMILIDEIENGFHYSFFPKLWEIIGKLATETECQVIATSHSYECIHSAECLAADTANPELFRFIRLDRHNSVISSKKYENEQFIYAINSGWEVR